MFSTPPKIYYPLVSSDEENCDGTEYNSVLTIGVPQSLALVDRPSKSTALDDDVLALDIIKAPCKTRDSVHSNNPVTLVILIS